MLTAILAAFGGGVLGAMLGALPAFIMCGFVCLAGTLPGCEFFGNVAFGAFFCPCISFAGGVAATAYAHNKKEINNGQSLDSIMHTNDPMGLIVGGVFGILGYLLNYLFADVVKFHTDTVALAVMTSGIIARLVFGKTGVFGKYGKDEKRAYFGSIPMDIVFGLGIGLLVAFGYEVLPADWGATYYQNMCFGIAAASLVFGSMGKTSIGFHHVIAPAAGATVMLGPVYGVVFAIIGSLLGDLLGNLYNNNHCDSHIDPPAGAIFIQMWIINLIAGNGFMG